jgi:palmitoyltransferase
MRSENLPKLWWVRSDPCGIFSAFFTVVLVLYAQYVMVAVIILPWYGMCWHVIAYSCCTVLSIISHSRAQFSDPGAVPLDLPLTESDDGSQARQCKWCHSSKPASALHCSTCARCVIRMDHHCPWVNNCVAMFNQKYFLLFLVYTAFCCIYSGALLVGRFVSCTGNIRMCTISTVHGVLAIINFVEALVFGLFVIIMFFDQMSAIFDTVAPPYLTPAPKSRSRYDCLKDVFGEPFSYRWFLPIAMPRRMMEDFKKEIQSLPPVKKAPISFAPGPVRADGLTMRSPLPAGQLPEDNEAVTQ